MDDIIFSISDGDFPFVKGVPLPKEFEYQKPYPTWAFRIKDGQDFPYLIIPKPKPVQPLYPVTKVYQYPYITVHDSTTPQDGFDNNGLRIIMPTRCEITEELNGTYELMLEMPIDEDGAWQSIREFNIIKACGQLFTIYRVVTQFRGNEGHLVAYAKHIFYKMADWWMPPNTRISRKYFITDILSVFSKCKNNSEQSPNTVDYKFSPSSDIQKSLSGSLADYSEMTALEAIYGNGADSLLNVYGGEIYRDNFRFSINEKMEGAKENGFHIRVGLNLTGIKRDVDFSDFCTELYCYDGFGGWRSKTWLGTGFFIPNNIIRSVTFKYDPETYSYDMLIADTDAYWAQVCYPKTTFEIDKANLRDNPDYSNFSELWDTKVGDSGVIYDERLGGEIKVRVIKTKRDGRNGNVTSVVLGNNGGLWRSGTGSGVGNKVQTKQDKETQEQIKQAKIKNMGTWGSLENYKWLEMGQFTWQEANGGN